MNRPLVDALSSFRRVLITGGPHSGKTTLARDLAHKTGLPLHHTDDLINLDWSVASQKTAEWIDEPEWIIEGVAIPRALRKWLIQNQDRELDAAAVYLRDVHARRTRGQVSMERAMRHVWEGIRPELRRRGVRIVLPHGSSSFPSEPSESETEDESED